MIRETFYDDENNQEQQTQEQQNKEQEQQNKEQEQQNKNKGKLGVKLSPEQQGYVNSLLAEEKRRAQSATEQLITQLETQKNLASTSQAEREALESRIDSLKAEFTTKEELQRKDSEKKIKELESKVQKSEKDALSWREKFVEDRIRSAIIAGAAEHKAYDPEQIYAILRPKTRLIDVLGEDNKPTGDFISRAKIEGKGQDGPTQLDLAVGEAIKMMTEMPEKYGNLFNSGSNGGLGGSASSVRGRVGLEPTDPEAYMEWRRKRKAKTNTG